MALVKEDIEIPLTAGLNTKAGTQALTPPSLLRAQNVQFDELGQLTNRYPYSTKGNSTPSNPRKLVTYEDELLLFTKDKLYSYSEADDDWVEKADYLAPKLTESSVFTSVEEQINADRAELDGVVVYVWEADGSVHAGALDKETGAVLAGPVDLDTGGTPFNPRRPRVVALDTRFVVCWVEPDSFDTYIRGLSVSPSSAATDLEDSPSALVSDLSTDYEYDVAPAPTTGELLLGYRDSSNNADLLTFTEDSLTQQDSGGGNTCDGPLAVAVAPDGKVVVVRTDTANTEVRGDILTSTLSNSSANNSLGAISSAPDQLTVAFRSTQDSGQYRAYAFWSEDETTSGSGFDTAVNWVDTGGSTGTESVLEYRLGVASHAFDHEGRIYVWCAFAGITNGTIQAQVQNSYFLYRDDGELIARAGYQVAGGFAQSQGHLPGVQNPSGNTYVWCGLERRIIKQGNDQRDYAQRSPRDIKLEFDSDEARRTAQLGRTLYITGSQILQYDGEGLTEVGFHVFPWSYGPADVGSGNVDDGVHTYLLTWRWDNAKGELDRSTAANYFDLDAVGDSEISFGSTIVPLHTTLKTGDRGECAIEVWRTEADPVRDAPAYLVSSKDPSATGDNGYLENNPDTSSRLDYTDNDSDATIRENELFPENGLVLANIAPPAASIIAADDSRVFLAGVSNDSNLVWYSKHRSEGEVAAFNDNLKLRVPHYGGDITALEVINDTLLVFKERAIFAFRGPGFSNTLQGSNYGPGILLPGEVGAKSAESVQRTPQGVIFHSERGWYLTDGTTVKYIGSPVADFDDGDFVAVDVVADQHQVRCVDSESRLLVWDTLVNQWAEWTVDDAVSSVVWNGRHYYLRNDGQLMVQDTAAGGGHKMDVELAWFAANGRVGFKRVLWFKVLGEYRSAHDLRIRVAYDYKESGYDEDKTWELPGGTKPPAGDREIIRHRLSRQKINSLKVRLTTQAQGSTDAPSGEGLKLTGLSFRVGLKPGGAQVTNSQRQ